MKRQVFITHEDGHALVAILTMMFALVAITAFLGRLFTKFMVMRRVGQDDLAVACAMVRPGKGPAFAACADLHREDTWPNFQRPHHCCSPEWSRKKHTSRPAVATWTSCRNAFCSQLDRNSIYSACQSFRRFAD